MNNTRIMLMICKLSFIFMFILVGCTTQSRRDSQDTLLEPDSLIEKISIEELLNLENVNLGNPLYVGFGDLWYSNLRSGRGIMFFDVEFHKIYFNKKKRELYVEGKLVSLGTDDQLEECQILIGREPIPFPDTIYNDIGAFKYTKIDYNYIIPRSGYFKANLPVFNYSIMFFTSREIYNDSGEYMGTPTSVVLAFDIYKLLKTTSE